jgi:hypothetical protein
MTQKATIAIVCILAATFILMCLVWRSCGTESTVVCPNGAIAKITSRGSFESGQSESICKELEDGGES